MSLSNKFVITPEQLQHLPPKFTHHPKKMIADFCSTFEFKECRDMLWRMIFTFFSAEESDALNRHERNDYLFFYQQLEALLEAAFLMHEKKLQKKSKAKTAKSE